MTLDFKKYRPRLLEYLSARGFQMNASRYIPCPAGTHAETETNHCSIVPGDEAFNCFSCGAKGDIYEAVRLIEGIQDRGEQYRFLENFFGDKPLPVVPPAKKQAQKLPFDAAAQKQVNDFIRDANKNGFFREQIRSYLSERAKKHSAGLVSSYPADVERYLLSALRWWPGIAAAEQRLGSGITDSTGIGTNPDTHKKTFAGKGCVISLPVGWKMFYYARDGESMKIGSRGNVNFPFPCKLPHGKRIIIFEGEIDALVARAIGIADVFAIGGLARLTDELILSEIIPAKIPEIILFSDKDPKLSGQMAFGLVPFPPESRKLSVPARLRACGYAGRIRTAILPGTCPYKDVDEAVVNGARQLVLDALMDAREWENPKEQKPGKIAAFNKISTKRALKMVSVQNLAYATMKECDRVPFAQALYKACPESEVVEAIVAWSGGGIPRETITRSSAVTQEFLLNAAADYGLSRYMKKALESELVPLSELARRGGEKSPYAVDVDIDDIAELPELEFFVRSLDENAAARLIERAYDGRLVYFDVEDKFYFFGGITWERVYDIVGSVVYDTLREILCQCAKKYPSYGNKIAEALTRIGSRTFREKIARDIKSIRGIVAEEINFDGPQIKDTITCADGVLDYTGREIVKRPARMDEFRRQRFPYTMDEILTAPAPRRIFKFFRNDFREGKDGHATFRTFAYYCSLIPSRNVGGKYGAFFLGKKDTGKSTACNLLSEIFSGMMQAIPASTFTHSARAFRNDDAPNPFIASSAGKGCLVVNETEDGAVLDTSQWKRFTGGDPIPTRQIFEKAREIKPTAQTIISSNYAPHFNAADDALARRMVSIPFSRHHARAKGGKTGADLIEELRPEIPGAIRAAIGLYMHMRDNLDGVIPLSAECTKYRNNYIAQERNDLQIFMDECFDIDKSDDFYITTETIYAAYLKFNRLNGDARAVISPQKLTRRIREAYSQDLNYAQRRMMPGTNPEHCFVGIAFKQDALYLVENPSAMKMHPLPAGAAAQSPQPSAYAPPPIDDPFAGATHFTDIRI